MPVDLSPLSAAPRLLFEVTLTPRQGQRFQPTGFPDLGPATYRLPSNGKEMLLVESPQSMANRLEAVCWDESKGTLAAPLEGLPYVAVKQGDKEITNSLLEAHRLNSPYILEGKDKSFLERLKQEVGAIEEGAVDLKLLAKIVLRYDSSSLLHGLFLAKKDLAGGRLRLRRALSSFVEAEDVREATSGGVKNDRVNPQGDAARGFGNVPFHREEFVAGRTAAYFNLDLQQIRNYVLGEQVEKLLIVLALWKCQALLDGGLRFRTACDLRAETTLITEPKGFELPARNALEQDLPGLIRAVSATGAFAKPAITVVAYEAATEPKEAKKKGAKG